MIVFTNEDKIPVKGLRKDKHYSVKKIEGISRQAMIVCSTGRTAAEDQLNGFPSHCHSIKRGGEGKV